METLEQSLKYRLWKAQLEKNNITLGTVNPLSIYRKPNGEILFAMLEAEMTDPEGIKLPSVVMLRGHFVSVMTILIEKETGNRYCLMVSQRRVASGELMYEHPAGMCDSEEDAYKVACKEVEEETGIHIEWSQLTPLNKYLVYTSPGLLDEAGYFFLLELEMTINEINDLRDKTTGDASESEHITLAVFTLEEALRKTRNISALMLIYGYFYYRGQSI